jgi:transposase
MWTETDWSTYRQAGGGLPSDLTAPEWQRLAQLIPPAKPGGRSRKTDMRSAMNAIFYLPRTRCPWRYLPRGIFRGRSTVMRFSRSVAGAGRPEGHRQDVGPRDHHHVGPPLCPRPFFDPKVIGSTTASEAYRNSHPSLIVADRSTRSNRTTAIAQGSITLPSADDIMSRCDNEQGSRTSYENTATSAGETCLPHRPAIWNLEKA